MRLLLGEFSEVNRAMEEEIQKGSTYVATLERQIVLMREEIERAAAHIAIQERESSLKEAEIQRLVSAGTNSGSDDASAESPGIAKFFSSTTNEGFRSTLLRIRGRIARRYTSRR